MINDHDRQILVALPRTISVGTMSSPCRLLTESFSKIIKAYVIVLDNFFIYQKEFFSLREKIFETS